MDTQFRCRLGQRRMCVGGRCLSLRLQLARPVQLNTALHAFLLQTGPISASSHASAMAALERLRCER
jgi:hypothetical protein